MNRRRFDGALLAAGALIFLLLLLSIAVSLYVPCDALGWLPASETPGRCFR